MKLFLATGNEHKRREFAQMATAAFPQIEVLSAVAVGGMPEVVESESTFTGNALRKALALYPLVPKDGWVLADDSGIRINALRGLPGVRSARFAGEKATDEENVAKVLELMKDVPEAKRGAAFQCAFVLIAPDQNRSLFMGSCVGSIARGPRGTGGFGYDPIFYPFGFEKTFAELPAEYKQRLSHRAHAARDLFSWMKHTIFHDRKKPDA